MVACDVLRAVLADLHLGQFENDLERFGGVIGELAEAGVGEVVFLGDLFRTLVGFPRFWGAEVRCGLGELGRLRRAGVRIVLVEGNRDFFLDRHELDPFRDACGISHSFAAGGRRFLLEHGDLINASDFRYRAWRALSKSAPARVWAKLLPHRLAGRIVSRTEQRLSRTNFSYRKTLPEEALTRAARRHFAAGVHEVMWGHFHEPFVVTERGCVARVVPGWLAFGTVMLVHPDGRVEERTSDEHGAFVDRG
jgi:UDP-2,3-diacylglucosamine pyrophosphatase LpxH